MRALCALTAALALAGCAGAGNAPEPELPSHPGAAWMSGSKKPVMDSQEVVHEGIVYEKEPRTYWGPERPRAESLSDPGTPAKRPADLKKSLAQSKKTLRYLQSAMDDMLKEKPKPLEQ